MVKMMAILIAAGKSLRQGESRIEFLDYRKEIDL
jgi:hypothetical protein